MGRKTVTVEVKYYIEAATETGHNPDGFPLQLMDAEGDRHAYVIDDEDAVRLVREIMDNALYTSGIEIDVDGTIMG